MGVVENIIAAVIITFVLLISGIIYITSSATDAVHSIGVKEDVFFDDSRITGLNTLLKITEAESGRNIGVLLADAVYYRNDSLFFNNKSINITNKTKVLLEMAFGHEMYFLEVKPRIIEVSLNFIIDGSLSLEQERGILALNLMDIIRSIEKKLNQTNEGYKMKVSKTPVIANIYLLGSKPEKCDLFNNIIDPKNKIDCFTLSGDDLYLRNTSLNTSRIFVNNTRFNLDSFLNFYNMTPPFGFAWLSPNVSYEASETDYADSDWGYGVGYASNFDEKTSLSRLTILFPMSDELSTSSFPDQCFFLPDWPSFTTCTLCVDDCPFDRSWKSVRKGLLIAKDNNHVINPIFSYSCDYVYDPDYNIAYEIDRFGSETHTITNACSEADCHGCTLDGSDVCFQPSCSGSILEQMDYMANATGGRVIDLADIATMDINITETIRQNIDQYALRIGEMRKELERDIIETTQPLPNGQLVDVRLWVYKN